MPKLTKGQLDPRVQELADRLKKDGLQLFREELPRRIELLTTVLQQADFRAIKIDDFVLTQQVVDKLDKTLAAGGDQLNRRRKRKADDVSGIAGSGGGGGGSGGGGGGSAEPGGGGASAGGQDAAAATQVAAAASSLPASSSSSAATEEFAAALERHTLAPVPSNERIVRMLRVLKEQHTDALDIAGTLKMWIQLNVPRIEDGNNFGVDVQTECIAQLTALEDRCCNVLEDSTKYFSGRAKLLTKCIKNPDVDDFRRSVEEMDHSQCGDVFRVAVVVVATAAAAVAVMIWIMIMERLFW
jgi:hypothetical protein